MRILGILLCCLILGLSTVAFCRATNNCFQQSCCDKEYAGRDTGD